MKTTEWFPVSIDPVRKGMYQVRDLYRRNCYAFWNGQYWGCAAAGFGAAFATRREKSEFMYSNLRVQWRGLAQEPKQ